MDSTNPQSEISRLFNSLLATCISEQASDLHLSAGLPPYLRVQGVLGPLPNHPNLSPGELALLVELLTRDLDSKSLSVTGSVDGALSSVDGTRFRFNIYKRSGEYSIALRRLEDRIRELSELGLSNDLYRLANLKDGLVILAGPTGCGKSTTLATLIDRINRTRACHVVTIEDPVEYIHPCRKALVNQRQIGSDASSFNEALVASMRQDPDVILVGEIREINTIRTAITAAETGHLVFTTVHASDCAGTIDRLVSVFPVDEQPGIRRQLAMVMRTVIAQHLVGADGPKNTSYGNNGNTKSKLVLASEVLNVNSAVANLIANGKDAQIYSVMETGAAEGMYTMEENLVDHLLRGEISEARATALCRNPKVLYNRMQQKRRGVTRATS